MATNIVIDPVTRIEGHLRIEAELGADGTVARAYSSSTMARGIEIIMKDRDPRDACHIAQRICGVCTVVHGLTSVRAIEDALGVQVPENAEIIRNMMIGAQYVHDHVMHFYHLHALDWVDVESALTADPVATATLAKSNNPEYYANVSEDDLAIQFQDVITKLENLRVNGQLGGLFSHGYWGHPEYRLPAIGNLLAVKHYLDALGWAREIVKLHTIFGGKDPHPDLVVGGVPCAVSANYGQQADEDRGGTSLNSVNMAKVSDLISQMQDFVDNVYVPDTKLIASFYKSDEFGYQGWEKRGASGGNFLCYGEFIETNVNDPANFLIPQGVIMNGDLTDVRSLDMRDTGEIKEYVAHSWYSYLNDNNQGLHPSEGETTLDYSGRNGPAPGIGYALNTGPHDGYSWIKSPRWFDHAMEVGPLAHVAMMYAVAKENPETDAEIAHALAKTAVDNIWIGELGLELVDIDSTLGRIAARTIETSVVASAMRRWHTKLENNITQGNLATFISDAEVVNQNHSLAGFNWANPRTWNNHNPTLYGVGFTEAPRGALGHWVSIEDGKIKNYQCIVASQWNAGPRDANGVPGPYEASLVGHTLAIPAQPLEILRTIHSFDPCIGCAVHVIDPEGEELIKVNMSTSLR